MAIPVLKSPAILKGRARSGITPVRSDVAGRKSVQIRGLCQQ